MRRTGEARRAADAGDVAAGADPIFQRARVEMEKLHADLSQRQPIAAKGEDLFDQLDEQIAGGLRKTRPARRLTASSPRETSRKR